MAGESVGVRAVIDSSPAKAGADMFNIAMGGMRDSVSKTAAKMNDLTGATSLLKGGLAALGAAFAIKSIAEAADDYTRLKLRLESLTGSTAAGAEALSKIKAAAKDSRTSTTDLADAYGKMVSHLKDQKLSSDDAINAMGSLSKAMQLGGSSADQIRGALDSFSRSFTHGRLEGRQFLDLMEEAPLLMQKLQQATGASADQIRRWALDGKFTGAAIVSVLKSVADEIDERFKTMPRTIGGSLTQLADTITKTVGQAFSDSGKVQSEFVKGMDSLREMIRSPEFQTQLRAIADNIGWLLQKIVEARKAIDDFKKAGGLKGWLGREQESLRELYPSDPMSPEVLKAQRYKDAAEGIDTLTESVSKLVREKNKLEIGPFKTTVEKGDAGGIALGKGQQELEIEKAIDLEKQQGALVRARVVDSREVVAQLEADLAVRARVTDEMKKIYPELAKQYDAQIRNTEAAKMHAQILSENKQIARGFGDTLTDGLISGIRAGQSLGDTFRDITAKIIEMIAKVTILNPLLNQIGRQGGSLLSGAGFDSEKGLFGAGMPLSGLGSFFGFADGGSFRVGGSGGTDSQLVAFKASPDETVSISRPDQRGGSASGAPSVVFNVAGDMTDETAAKVQGMIEATWAQRSPKLISASVDAVNDRHQRDRKFLMR